MHTAQPYTHSQSHILMHYHTVMLFVVRVIDVSLMFDFPTNQQSEQLGWFIIALLHHPHDQLNMDDAMITKQYLGAEKL